MDEFVEKLKQGANMVFGNAEKFTTAAVDKAGSMVEQTKLGYAIKVNEEKIKDILAELGKNVYDEYKSGSEFPEKMSEKLAMIDSLNDEILEMKAKIADMKNSVVCHEYGAYNDSESVYCSKCGKKL